MSISASQIVKVVPRVINAGGRELQTVGMILTENPLCPFPKTLEFATASSVGSYFGLTSKEYEMATNYFLGYDNSFKKPNVLHFGRYVPSAISATYIGTGAVSSVTTIKSITNGKVVFVIDGVRKVCKNLNFSDVATQSDIAQVLELALGNAKVAYNSNLNAYVITSGSYGDNSNIVFESDGGGEETYEIVARFSLKAEAADEGYSLRQDGLYKLEDGATEPILVATWEEVNTSWDTYNTLFAESSEGEVYRYVWEGDTYTCYDVPDIATSAVAEPMGLLTATSWKGATAKTPAENMEEIVSYDQNWVSFTTLNEVSTDIIMGFAEWVNGKECEYLYCPYTTNPNDKNSLATDNLPSQLKARNFEGVLLTFGTTKYAILPMTIGACIDWDRVNGLPTYAFKAQSGLEATIDNDYDAIACEGMNVNFYGHYKARSDEFLFYYQGAMSGGAFGFVDAFIGQLWLRNVLQIAILNGVQQIGRVPYGEEGYTYIKAWCQDPINRALVNGVIQPGLKISEAQKATLSAEVGADVSDAIITDGYYLMVTDPPATTRAERGTPTMGLWYGYLGACHKFVLPCSAVL